MAGFFDTLFGGGAEREAAEKNRALLAQYGPQAQGYLTTGYQTGQANLGSAIGAYDPLSALGAKYGGASDLYLGALGAAGPEAAARAKAAWPGVPGNELAISSALDVLNRRRAGQGMGMSGNADIDALTFAQTRQNEQYDRWLQNLAQAGQTGVGLIGAAAQGRAGGFTNLANLAQQYAQNQTGVAGNVLQGGVSANTLQAQGEAAGAKNLLGAGLSLATLGMGGNPFGGSLFGSGGGGFSNSLFGRLATGLGNLPFGGGSPSGYGVG
jgi:hypothetical protein